jgi:hypothetical protein
MGDISDYYREQEDDSQFSIKYFKNHYLGRVPKSSSDYIWTTNKGANILVGRMTTNHVKNSLNAIRTGKIFASQSSQLQRTIWSKIFTDELVKRG